jgi:hypothetical protein
MDTSSFIMITGCFSLVLLLTRYRQRLWFGTGRLWLWRVGAAGWALVCVAGLWLLCDRALRLDIPEREFFQRMQLKTTREFLATDDVNVILHKPRNYRLRPDSAQIEAELLRNPIILQILPACVRKPLNVIPDEAATHGFTLHGCMPPARNQPVEPWWGSCAGTGSQAPSVFESKPVQKSSFPFLQFPVAGYLGEPGVSMSITNSPSGKAEAVRPSRLAENRWVDAIVPAPAGEFKITARAESEAKWLAFKEPRELGRLSVWTVRMVAAWKYFVIVGIACLCLSLALHREKSGLGTGVIPPD